ncbi:hypothetical protein MTO96_011658 [Rhipicephalus appendiculatus]
MRRGSPAQGTVNALRGRMQCRCFFSTRRERVLGFSSIDPTRRDGCSRGTEVLNANNDQLLLRLRQMNELIEQVGNQESRSAVITQDVAPPATSEMAQAAAESFDLVARELLDRIRLGKPARRRHPGFTALLSTADTWRQVLGKVTSVLIMKIFQVGHAYYRRKLAGVTVLHSRDSYFAVEVYHGTAGIRVLIEFRGLEWGSRCPVPVLIIKAYNRKSWNVIHMSTIRAPCTCKREMALWVHYHRIVYTEATYWTINVTLLDEIKFLVEPSLVGCP